MKGIILAGGSRYETVSADHGNEQAAFADLR